MLRKHGPFLLILLAFLLTAGQFARETPPWQAPDEPAHYNYVKQLAAGAFPVMENQDYDQTYQAAAISARFAPPYSIDPFTYEDYQPPLYYLLQTPVFWLSGGRLLPLRLVGVMLGALTLVAAYAVFVRLEQLRGRTAGARTPDRYPLALTAAALFAFLPQHLALQASVNNDSLSELLIAVTLLVICRRLGPDRAAGEPAGNPFWRSDWLLGLLLGLAFLTKVTTYLLAPVLALFLLWRFWGDWPGLWRAGLRVFGPALALGAIWWGRNLAVYGWPDFLGIAAHDRAVVGQPTTAEWLALYGGRELLLRFTQTTFRSFWGQFGWMGVVMDPRIYQGLGFLSLLILAGWAVGRRRAWGSAENPSATRPLALTFGVLLGLNIALYLAYNVTYVQHQGRYLFAALVPLAWAAALGLHGWLLLLRGRLPWLQQLLPLGLAAGLVALNFLALYRFIIPQLALP